MKHCSSSFNLNILKVIFTLLQSGRRTGGAAYPVLHPLLRTLPLPGPGKALLGAPRCSHLLQSQVFRLPAPRAPPAPLASVTAVCPPKLIGQKGLELHGDSAVMSCRAVEVIKVALGGRCSVRDLGRTSWLCSRAQGRSPVQPRRLPGLAAALSRYQGSQKNSAQSSPLRITSQESQCRGCHLGKTTCGTQGAHSEDAATRCLHLDAQNSAVATHLRGPLPVRIPPVSHINALIYTHSSWRSPTDLQRFNCQKPACQDTGQPVSGQCPAGPGHWS